jgi:hypothetical protein
MAKFSPVSGPGPGPGHATGLNFAIRFILPSGLFCHRDRHDLPSKTKSDKKKTGRLVYN